MTFPYYDFLYFSLSHGMFVLNKAYLAEEKKQEVESKFYNLEHQFTVNFKVFTPDNVTKKFTTSFQFYNGQETEKQQNN